jgi:hypothetical protein
MAWPCGAGRLWIFAGIGNVAKTILLQVVYESESEYYLVVSALIALDQEAGLDV